MVRAFMVCGAEHRLALRQIIQLRAPRSQKMKSFPLARAASEI